MRQGHLSGQTQQEWKLRQQLGSSGSLGLRRQTNEMHLKLVQTLEQSLEGGPLPAPVQEKKGVSLQAHQGQGRRPQTGDPLG